MYGPNWYPDVDCHGCGDENLMHYFEINKRHWRTDLEEYEINGCFFFCHDCMRSMGALAEAVSA